MTRGPENRPNDGAHGPTGAGRSRPPADERATEAQAALDQLRTQAGGALSGSELKRRFGLEEGGEDDAPPLDWRLTPRNVILQLGAIALFVAAIWFLGALVTDGVSSLFG
ncbi:MAG: hypothetical protein AAFW46_05825 [Pseudomonadota bacterium]